MVSEPAIGTFDGGFEERLGNPQLADGLSRGEVVGRVAQAGGDRVHVRLEAEEPAEEVEEVPGAQGEWVGIFI